MFRRYRKQITYLFILLIPFLLFFFRPKNSKALIKLDSSGVIVGIFDAPLKEILKVWYYRETYDAYVQLKKRNDILKARLVALQNSIDAVNRDAVMEKFRRSQPFASLVANVIGRDPTNWNAALIINRGKNSGIKIGMPVITPLGVVGRIAEVGSTTAKVIMLADPNFAVAAVVGRTRESGLLTGTLQGLCRLQYLTDGADVKVGDQVVTSALSTAFPEGVLIGDIVEVRASATSHSVDCLVNPAVDLAQIDDVIIIKDQKMKIK